LSSVLVTGASGFVGSRLIVALAEAGHRVIALSRNPADAPVRFVRGDFADPADLASLDGEEIDVAIHLGGVTGAADEEDAIAVNVGGTRRLLRYLADRGVRHTLIASSIAATGCLSADFVPRALPIPDDHPCDSTNVYGVSKKMVEELAGYFSRLEPTAEYTLFRLGVVVPEDAPPITQEAVEAIAWPFCDLGIIAVQDVVEAFARAVDLPLGPGLRIMNLVAPTLRSTMPTVDTVRLLLGARADALDFRHYAQPGREHDGVYSSALCEELYGFRARVDVATMTEVRPHEFEESL
jgi:UDP-glucose 4-epimerase